MWNSTREFVKAAPFLRLSGVSSFATCLHLLSARVPLTHLTAFSDDILSEWVIASPDDVALVLSDMSFIIDTLTDLGMSVSDAKTVIIDGLRGPTKVTLAEAASALIIS